MAAAMFLNVAPGADAPEDAMQRSRDAWAELLMLPKCVLAAATRSGKKHKHVLDRLIRSRLQQWADGDRLELWRARTEAKAQQATTASEEQRRRRAIALAEEGLDGQACKALLSKGMADTSLNTLRALKRKHPEESEARDLRPLQGVSGPQEDFLDKEVLAALRSFPKCSASGPSGLKAQHLLDAVGRHMPGLEAWARWCCGGPSDLLFGSHVLTSSRGVQQGDALGPLLFSVAVHPLLQELKTDAGLDIVCGYLGDFCVAGEFGATLRALRLIQRKAASLGLELNLDKCECNLSEFPASVQRRIDGCFKLLGAPVGGTALNESQRQQAPLPLSKGGLGFRSGSYHAAAVYLSSRAATRHLCGQIDAAFSRGGACDGGALTAAADLYNGGALQEHRITSEHLAAEDSAPSQRSLSMRVGERLLDQLIAASPVAHKARLLATSAPHASAWLQAQPCSARGQRMSHFEFVAALRLWLGCHASSRDDWRPKCDQVMDAQGLHSLSCMAGGDAVKVHNALRDQVHSFAHAAGLRAEKEESGLLPDDPRRRPRDTHFPTWPLGPPVALEFAVTPPLRQSAVQGAAARQLSAATSYEGAKLADRDTGARCEQLGIRLVPMVVESFGGWGEMAQDVFRTLIHARAARSGETVSNVTTYLYSGLSITLMRANARALLARIPQEAGVHADHVGRAATLLQAGRQDEADAQIV
ncbi:unnamed protein product [Prorocentrum cordatum]|uniref:Reverse transcriptase domain-containing protein n=1 Tax=Prorocentrum cordatum TaxID=2364126 RepID=A0ABN9UMC2_9DINO|nr:unnamed protein product [Polarella glacialis]